MKTQLTLLLAASSLAMLTACGTPGAPQPPSLQLPHTVQDLTATRKGDVVTLTWTPPSQTTDGQNIRTRFAGPTYICRTIDNRPMLTCQYSVGTVPAVIPLVPAPGENRPPAPAKVEYVDRVPLSIQQQNPTGFADYTVEVTNYLRRSAGLSNHVRVPLAPTLEPPRQIQARVNAEAIDVSFVCPASLPIQGLASAARLYRRDPAGNVAQVGSQPLPASACSISDSNFEWERTYTYWVDTVTTVSRHGRELARVAGDDSPATTVVTHDVFPPAVPNGLEAVASGVGQKLFIDLTWTPDMDPDLDGYNIYRQEQGTTTWVKLNSRVKTPAFRDEGVQRGRTYTYAISAIDVRGNESGRSGVASETVP